LINKGVYISLEIVTTKKCDHLNTYREEQVENAQNRKTTARI